jgi:hypothetical protein
MEEIKHLNKRDSVIPPDSDETVVGMETSVAHQVDLVV